MGLSGNIDFEIEYFHKSLLVCYILQNHSKDIKSRMIIEFNSY